MSLLPVYILQWSRENINVSDYREFYENVI